MRVVMGRKEIFFGHQEHHTLLLKGSSRQRHERCGDHSFLDSKPAKRLNVRSAITPTLFLHDVLMGWYFH
jgi:hypothetical protein